MSKYDGTKTQKNLEVLEINYEKYAKSIRKGL